MSIKSKVLATAATLALVGGVGTAGVLGTAATANAATPSCGGTCVDIFSQEFGNHHDPSFVLDVYQQHIRIGQPIILYRASNDDPAEDFRLQFQGTVADFLAAQLVTPALALHYGCLSTLANGGLGNFPDCFGLTSVPLGFIFSSTVVCTTSTPGYNPVANTCPAAFNDPAFEIEYTPERRGQRPVRRRASTAVPGGGRDAAGVRRLVQDGLGGGPLRPAVRVVHHGLTTR